MTGSLRFLLVLTLVAGLFLVACGDDSDSQSDGDSDVIPDGDTDETPDGDTPDGDIEADPDEEARPEGLPETLAISYEREDVGDPVTTEEIQAFTRRVMGFLKKINYFDFVLYTTHGVDASTGQRDWQFWYNERFKKEGDLVTFYHPENLTDGGHNLHIPMSRVLGDVLAAHMLVDEDATIALAAEKLCKGMSASMLGMVKDENDTVHHLMTRNVIAMNHEFLTHDGKRKAVNYDGWRSPYDRWNCYRYAYPDNPFWDDVWVTSLRSKDDVPHVFRLIPNLRYAVDRSGNEAVQEACGEALELLEAFAKDIVDSDYHIRTKDENGEIYMPGFTDDPALNAEQGDLAALMMYRDLIPGAECSARQAAENIAYHQGGAEDCGRGEPNQYDQLSFQFNRYNKRICRYFHLAHIANALVNHENAAVEKLLDGLEERITLDQELPESQFQYDPDDWYRNLALYYTQAQSYGYPLTSAEVRSIHSYYLKAIEEYMEWPYWDPWAASVPEGELGAYHPPNCKTVDEERVCWWRSEDLGQIFENCWSPLTNPNSAQWVDCDIVRDPSQWDESVLDEATTR